MKSKLQLERIHPAAMENFHVHDTDVDTVAFKLEDHSEHSRLTRKLDTRKSTLKGPRRSEMNPTKLNNDRFIRTAALLQSTGLLGIAIETAKLLKENNKLQEEIDKLEQTSAESELGFATQSTKLLEENIGLQKEIDQLEKTTLSYSRRLQEGRKRETNPTENVNIEDIGFGHGSLSIPILL